jgi:N-acetylglutamate synthase-like GNAT family acetyltransferase
MTPEKSSKLTGISDITGKIVRIKHATEADMGFILENLKKYHLDMEDLHHSQFVIAAENGNLIGFGRLKNIGETYEIGCVVVIEERRGRGIGSLIVKHLIDYSPLKTVYVITDLVDYFIKLGFAKTEEGSKELLDSLDRTCKIKGKQNAVLMVYKKEQVGIL